MAGKTTTTRKTSNTTRTTTVPDSLKATSLDFARELLDDLDAEWNLVPATHRAQFTKDLEAITTTCRDLKITTVARLVDARTKVLSALTGLSTPGAYQKASDAHPLHRYRNTLVTLAVAAAPNFDPAAILAEARSTLRQRTAKRQRPLLDDEIVLLRTVAALTEMRRPASQRTAVYAQCDAGMLVAETTQARVCDLGGGFEQPLAISAAGNRFTAGRPVPLGAFHRRALVASVAAAATRGDDALLSYAPRTHKPGSKPAAASANSIIGSMLFETGLAHPDTTPFSLTRWRIAHTLATQGLDAAVEIAGRSKPDTARLADPDPDIAKITTRAKENFMLLPAVA